MDGKYALLISITLKQANIPNIQYVPLFYDLAL